MKGRDMARSVENQREDGQTEEPKTPTRNPGLKALEQNGQRTQHIEIISETHIIDVISTVAPTVRKLGPR